MYDMKFSGMDKSFFYGLADGGSTIIAVDFLTGAKLNSWASTLFHGVLRQLAVVPDPSTDSLIIREAEGVLFFDVPRSDPVVTSLVNGASFQDDGIIAPDEWITVYGGRFAPLPTYPDPAVNTLPSQLGGIRVLLQAPGISDSFLPMNYVGPNQINLITPKNMPVGIQSTLTVQRAASDGTWISAPPIQANTAAAAPALFGDGNGNPWVVHMDGHFDTTAASGELVSFYGNALGPVQPGSYGLMWNFPLPTFTINGIPATIAFSGLQPDFVGLYQSNVWIPAGIPDGDQPLSIQVGTAVANMKVLIKTPQQ